MGYVTCGMHGRDRQGPRCCWECDRCPRCEPSIGKLAQGDLCRSCRERARREGFRWDPAGGMWRKPETGPSLPL